MYLFHSFGDVGSLAVPFSFFQAAVFLVALVNISFKLFMRFESVQVHLFNHLKQV